MKKYIVRAKINFFYGALNRDIQKGEIIELTDVEEVMRLKGNNEKKIVAIEIVSEMPIEEKAIVEPVVEKAVAKKTTKKKAAK